MLVYSVNRVAMTFEEIESDVQFELSGRDDLSKLQTSPFVKECESYEFVDLLEHLSSTKNLCLCPHLFIPICSGPTSR